jgi:hypothetical protein
MYSLKVENNNIDISTDFSVALSYNAIDTINPLARNAAFTYTLNIPRTANNNKEFNYVGEYDVIDKFKKNQFNCVLSYLNNEIIKGIFYLDEITETNFRGQIVSDNLNWTKNFNNDDRLNELSGFTVDFPNPEEKTRPFRWMQKLARTGTSLNNDINFPFITRGNYNTYSYKQQLTDITGNYSSAGFAAGGENLNRFNFLDIPPCYYLVNSIKNVFSYYGLNVESNVFQDLEKAVIPYCGNGEFKWNWGRVGTFRQTLSESIVDAERYLRIIDFNYSNYDLPSARFGIVYTVFQQGKLTIDVTARTNTENLFIGISNGKDGEIRNVISTATASSVITWTDNFNVGDFIYVYGRTVSDSGPNFSTPYKQCHIYYPDEPYELNIQGILPSVTPLDWIKNFINMFGLYPYYVEYTKTVYLLTLDEFLKVDDFNLISIDNKSIKDYVTIGSLKYAYDTKDPLISEFQYDYLKTRGTEINLQFAPSATRPFLVSYKDGSAYSSLTQNIMSIASADIIALDRLTINQSDIINFPAWDSATNYNVGDGVEYLGAYYVARRANNDIVPISSSYFWGGKFIGQYNTDQDWDLKTRILDTKITDSRMLTSDTGFFIISDWNVNSDDRLFYLVTEFPDKYDLKNIYDKYYRTYNTLINNRTNIIEGDAYIPRHKFNEYINRPVELNYLNDRYILIGITGYNPETEIGKVQVIKKVSYTDYI